MELPDGPYTITSQGNYNTVQTKIDLENGKEYFIWQDVKGVARSVACILYIETAETAKSKIAKCRLIKTNFKL